MRLKWIKENFIIVAVLIIIVISLGGYAYTSFSKEGIYERVLDRKGYKVYLLKDNITFKGLIKPEWIPKTANDERLVNKKVAETEGLDVILDKVNHRGDDIYFSFIIHPDISYKQGKFLSTSVIDDVEGVNQGMGLSIHIYNDTQNIEHGQWGIGPLDRISFGINIDDFEQIQNGFNFEYTGFYLYGYHKSS